MRIFGRGLCLISLFLSLAVTSQAGATTLDWTFDPTKFGPGGSGTLTLDSSNDVTAIDGTWDGMTITGLVSFNPYVGNDNELFYPNTPYLDLGGLLFSLSNGYLENLYYLSFGDQPPYQGEEVDAHGNVVDGIVSDGTLSISPQLATTPLPASLPLFATSIAALGMLCWLRRRKAAAGA